VAKKTAITILALAAVLTLVATAFGAATKTEKYKLRATLKARGEVPAPKGAAGGTGLFSGTLTESADSKTIRWKLTFSRLTGAAGAAHIHAGRPGHAGPVLVSLCGPCTSGQAGTAKVTEAIVKKLESGAAYVNVHTSKNPGGEIRGQIKVSDD
jgi:hypothetical protein